jgi:DNA helicase-2/ATP-dependent DNA helicase PcrA
MHHLTVAVIQCNTRQALFHLARNCGICFQICMPITPAQQAAAEQQQNLAAQNAAPQVRLVAGPGTGKSKVIEKRVAHILNNGAAPNGVYVISFTVAASAELRDRIAAHCATLPCAAAAAAVRVSTLHALALSILRSANLLAALYPHDPCVLDDWETKNVYDLELAHALGCTPTRAAVVRIAHDAAWQTLNPIFINQPAITIAETNGFNAFHATRANLYSCVLPGELVYRCVEALRMGQIQPAHLPNLQHLIVDEFQDLNACDQELISRLAAQGAVLFVAGDDDQSIYSFRHADPSGLVNFQNSYPRSSTQVLNDCFRCTPNVLNPAAAMIAYNPARLAKNPNSLYAAATPPVMGISEVWSFHSEQDEADALASSCSQLIQAGMAGSEDEILILISDRGLQLDLIAQALGNLGLPYDPPPGDAVTSDDGIRCVFCFLRIARDLSLGQRDYVSHRVLLALLAGVGITTAKGVADACVQNNQNFRDLFYAAVPPPWLNPRQRAAVARVSTIVQTLNGWSLVADALATRLATIDHLLANVFNDAAHGAKVAQWNALVATLPLGITLEELLTLFGTDNDADRRLVFDRINQRLGVAVGPAAPLQRRIRIMTMHGAKGLSGKVIFIPSVEQGIMPSRRNMQAAGLLIEHRRLFYVSVTRAKAACFISHSALHTGASAFRLRQVPQVRLPRSQFLNEMQIPSVNKIGGLTAEEAATVVNAVNNL